MKKYLTLFVALVISFGLNNYPALASDINYSQNILKVEETATSLSKELCSTPEKLNANSYFIPDYRPETLS